MKDILLCVILAIIVCPFIVTPREQMETKSKVFKEEILNDIGLDTVNVYIYLSDKNQWIRIEKRTAF